MQLVQDTVMLNLQHALMCTQGTSMLLGHTTTWELTMPWCADLQVVPLAAASSG